MSLASSCFFFYTDTATTDIYTLSLHDALPICLKMVKTARDRDMTARELADEMSSYFSEMAEKLDISCDRLDRKSTRLNSSHVRISYAVFCLKKKKKNK